MLFNSVRCTVLKKPARRNSNGRSEAIVPCAKQGNDNPVQTNGDNLVPQDTESGSDGPSEQNLEKSYSQKQNDR